MLQNSSGGIVVSQSSCAMTTQTYTIRQVTTQDIPLVKQLIESDWGGEPFVIREGYFYPSQLPGIIACSLETVEGYLFYEIRGTDCEVIVIKVFNTFQGLGTKLIERVKQIALEQGCSRIFLMTTNDNIDALRFYQKRGFHIFNIRINALETTRLLMPQLGYYGRYGIAKRDEIYLELTNLL